MPRGWVDRTWDAQEAKFLEKLNELGITLEEFTKAYFELWAASMIKEDKNELLRQ